MFILFLFVGCILFLNIARIAYYLKYCLILDKGVKNRKTYLYKIEDIDLNGKNTMHGTLT